MGSENYLIVCNTIFQANSLLKRVAVFLGVHGVTNMKVHKSHRVITTTDPSVTIRFTTQAKVFEDSRGFRGTIVTSGLVDKYLDPWETSKARQEIFERFQEIL